MMRLIDAKELSKHIHMSDHTIRDNFDRTGKGLFTAYLDWLIATSKTIEVEPVKQGEWKFKTIRKFDIEKRATIYEPIYECSVCGGITESYLRLGEPIMPEDAGLPRYCQNCGAKMEMYENY